LRRWRFPTSIIATFAFMKWFGFTLNNVTMLALVLMVGVVIDDAIVVLENVFHCIEEKGMDPAPRGDRRDQGNRPGGAGDDAVAGDRVLPVSFLSSVTGRMLYEFGMTATVAILVSMLVSFSLTPMMCSKLLRGAKGTRHKRRPPRAAGRTPGSKRRTWSACGRRCGSAGRC
jgi:hydrophobic/amphiphilic exporter-1 (mainly G- bacteria), HAE1 family